MNKILLFFIISVTAVYAGFLEQNSHIARLNDFEYKTPTDEVVKIPKDVKIIIVSFEKETGVLVNEYLGEQDAAYLKKYHGVFIADIHKMPTIITNMFAIPKLKKYKHPIHINYGEGFATVVPSKEDKVTLFFVENSRIKDIAYVSTKEELKTAIEK